MGEGRQEVLKEFLPLYLCTLFQILSQKKHRARFIKESNYTVSFQHMSV